VGGGAQSEQVRQVLGTGIHAAVQVHTGRHAAVHLHVYVNTHGCTHAHMLVPKNVGLALHMTLTTAQLRAVTFHVCAFPTPYFEVHISNRQTSQAVK
jgi:hypothetical protein